MSSSELQLTHGDLAPLAGGAAGRHLGPRADSLTNGGARRVTAEWTWGSVMEGRYRTLFPYKPDPMPSFFRHTLSLKVKNPKFEPFWGQQKFLGASEAGKQQQFTTMRNFVVQWSFEKLDFFSLTNQKNWLYNTNNEQISNSNSLFVVNL